MKNYLLFFCLMMLSICDLSADVAITEQDALALVKHHYGVDSARCNYWIGELKSLSEIHLDTLDCSEAWLSDTTVSKWVVFVDEMPNKNWPHNCHYFYFRKQNVNEQLFQMFDVVGKTAPKKALTPVASNREIVMRDALYESRNEPCVFDSTFCDFRNEDVMAMMVATGDLPWTNYARFMRDVDYLYNVLDLKYNVCPLNMLMLTSSPNFLGEAYDTYLNQYVRENTLYNYNSYGVGLDTAYATYENVKRVLRIVANDSSVVDKHFLFFYSGHGAFDERGYSLALPSDTFEKTSDNPNGFITKPLYADELRDLLDSIPCRSMTVVLGQCHSGGFIESLAAPNRVVLAACQPNEESFGDYYGRYDVFLRHWTDAINECDSIGAISSDVDMNGRVSMKEAFDYAESKEIVNDYDGVILEEHPMYSSVHEALGDDVAFNCIPDSVDLYLRDNVDDTGKEYNMTTNATWNSPDLWLRNQNDGIDCQVNEDITTSGEDITTYLYARISNRGLGCYQDSSKIVTVYWVRPWIDPNSTLLNLNPLAPKCGLICSVPLNDAIDSDSSIVLCNTWQMPMSYFIPASMLSGSMNLGLLAVVEDTIRTYADEQLVYNTLLTRTEQNDVALKNIRVVKTNPGGGLGPIIMGVNSQSSGSQVTVSLNQPAAAGTKLVIVHATEMNNMVVKDVEVGQSELTLPTYQIPNGVCVSALSVDGQFVDVKMFVKE